MNKMGYNLQATCSTEFVRPTANANFAIIFAESIISFIIRE